MRNLFIYIVCFFLTFKGAAAYTAPVLPDDFTGKETRQIVSEKINDDSYETTLTQNFNMFYEISTYLYQKYSWDELHEDNFTEKLQQFYPDDSEDELQKKHSFLLKVYGIYKFGKDLYVKFANKYLVPHAYRKVRDDSEYDHPREVAYVPVADDEYAKVYNFKKFLTYSENDDERNAISDYERQKKDNGDFLTQFDRIIEKVEWNKVLFYGVTYENPLFSNSGVGEAYFGKWVNARFLSRDTYTEQNENLELGLQIAVNPHYFVLANNLSAELQKPQFNFAESVNIADVQVYYPMPQQTDILPQAHKYLGIFLIPLKVTPLDKTADINLKADVTLTVCDAELNCQPQSFALQLPLKVSGPDKFDNGFDNLFFNSFGKIPTADSPHLTLKHFYLTDTPEGKQLCVEMETSKNINGFYAYIENTAGYTHFAAPRYVLSGRTVKAYFKPLPESADTDLAAAEYIISANLNNRYFYRDRLTPQIFNETFPEELAARHNRVLAAFICGLCLNALPFAAPFMLILLIVFIRLHKRKPEILRQRQMQVLKGSITGMLIVFALLLSRKHYSETFLWGMQFDNLTVSICLLFILVTVLKLLPSFMRLLTDYAAAEKSGSVFCHAYGLLLGLSLIFDVAPHLTETMNLAFVLPILIYCAIAGALICGFCCVQILLLYLPSYQKLWHKIGNSQKGIIVLIRYALLISIWWILLFIFFRLGFLRTLFFAVILIIWGFLCKIYQYFSDYISDGVEEQFIPHLPKIRRGSIIFMTACLALATTLCICKADKYLLQTRKIAAAEHTDLPNSAAIATALQQNQSLLLTFETDWCFACQFNRFWTFNPYIMKQWREHYDLNTVSITDIAVLTEYMHKYKQYALPFYILYTPHYPQGIVLSSAADEAELEALMY